MPVDFDFNRDIAPHVSNYLGEISRDTRLRPETARRLMSDVITGTNDVEMQRLKLQAEQQNSVLRQIRIEQGQLALQDARRQTRMFEEMDQYARSSAQEINSVMSGQGSTEEKRQKIAAIGINYMGTPAGRAVESQLETAFRALPPERTKGDTELSTSLIQEAVANEIPEDILMSGDKYAIAASIGDAVAKRRRMAEMEKAALEDEKELKSLLSAPVKFVEDPNQIGVKWLDPESHDKLKILVNTVGTPEERQAFYGTQDDSERARIASDIKVREMSNLLQKRDNESDEASRWMSLGGAGGR